MTQLHGKIEGPMNDDRSLSPRRDRPPPPPRQAEPPPAGLGEVARDVVDHLQVIVRDELAIAKLEARRAVERAKERAKAAAPRVAFGIVAGVAALLAVVFLLIAIFIALGDAVPSVGWRLAIFGIFFLVVSVIAAIFAGSRETEHEEAPRRAFAEAAPRGPEPRPALPPEPRRSEPRPALRH
jgi:hypothetical protein